MASTLLETVIEEAQGAGSVPVLLRRLKVLATRTGARDTLLPWVNSELVGYRPDHDVLPSYRGPFPTAPVGSYIGMGGTTLTDHHVARTGFEDSLAEVIFNQSFLVSVAELEVAAGRTATYFSWPAELVDYYNSVISRGKAGVASHFACLGVKYSFSQAVFVGILDQVRNIALDLALELEEVAPQAGEPGAGDVVNTEARELIQHHFHIEGMVVSGSNITFGGEGSIAQGIQELQPAPE